MTKIDKTKRTSIVKKELCWAANTTKDRMDAKDSYESSAKHSLQRTVCSSIVLSLWLSRLFILQYKNCDFQTFAKNDSWLVFRGVLKNVRMRAANYLLSR